MRVSSIEMGEVFPARLGKYPLTLGPQPAQGVGRDRVPHEGYDFWFRGLRGPSFFLFPDAQDDSRFDVASPSRGQGVSSRIL